MKVKVFIGVIGSGKGYRTDRAIEEGYVKVDFADAVRRDVFTMLGWFPKTPNEYEAFKTTVFTDHLLGISFTGRQLLQRYGTDIRRSENHSIWCERLVQEIKNLRSGGVEKVVVSDCRYLNEVEHLLSLVGLGGRIELDFAFCDFRSSKYDPNSDHSSEALSQHLLKHYGFRDLDENFNKFIKDSENIRDLREQLEKP